MADIHINDDLFKRLEAIVNDSPEHSDVDAYATYILQQVADKKAQVAEAQKAQDAAYSKEDEDKIRDRLKNLGYLE